jgi:hypothetical protein
MTDENIFVLSFDNCNALFYFTWVLCSFVKTSLVVVSHLFELLPSNGNWLLVLKQELDE